MDINLREISDADLLTEYRRRDEIERNFTWSVSLMRDFAVWESESGRARRITEWHARQIAERLCDVLGFSREQFANQVIKESKRSSAKGSV